MAFNGVITADRLVEPSYGLFSVAEVTDRGPRDESWIGGFFVETLTCGRNTVIQPLCIAQDDSPQEVFDSSNSSPFFHVMPFGIIEKFACENSIGYNAIDRRATVVEQLKTISEFAIEQELWTGGAAQEDANPIPADRWLISATDVTPTAGTGVKAKLALALVEQAFSDANPGVQATIHISPLISSILIGHFDEDNHTLYTQNGSKVTINRGGGGVTGPASGGSATHHWIYATGPVHVDIGGDELITVSASEIVNPTTNAVTYVAERPAAVYFDGCAWFGALADATL